MPHAVDRQLIFLAAHSLEPLAHTVGEVKRIPEYGERNILFLQQRNYRPEFAMQNRIAARYVEIGQTIHFAAHVLALSDDLHRFVKRHFDQVRMPFRKNIAVLAALVAAVGYVPLKSEVFHCGTSYFSPAPQAEPHAAGLGSGFSSPAPQAEPHAPAGFSVSAAALK